MNCNCEAHNMHYCHLKRTGQDELLRSITDNPAASCSHCGARVNDVKYVCAAHLGGSTPNVEGGHGSVNLDDVGKPHSG